MIVEFVKNFLSGMTLVSQIFIVLFIIILIFQYGFKKKSRFNEFVIEYLRNHSMLIILIISLTSIIGSLFFSEIAGFDPCKLCWIQRIFMYPIALLLIVAMKFKDKFVYRYVLPMSIIGGLFALYHYYIASFQIRVSEVCDATSSCLVEYFTGLGYITIPLMSFTGFLMIFILSLMMIKNK